MLTSHWTTLPVALAQPYTLFPSLVWQAPYVGLSAEYNSRHTGERVAPDPQVNRQEPLRRTFLRHWRQMARHPVGLTVNIRRSPEWSYRTSP